MAIGTDGTYSRRIFVVNARFELFVNRGHFMAGDTKCEAVGLFDDRMKPTPENNAGQGADEEYTQCCFIYSFTHACTACKKPLMSIRGFADGLILISNSPLIIC